MFASSDRPSFTPISRFKQDDKHSSVLSSPFQYRFKRLIERYQYSNALTANSHGDTQTKQSAGGSHSSKSAHPPSFFAVKMAGVQTPALAHTTKAHVGVKLCHNSFLTIQQKGSSRQLRTPSRFTPMKKPHNPLKKMDYEPQIGSECSVGEDFVLLTITDPSIVQHVAHSLHQLS